MRLRPIASPAAAAVLVLGGLATPAQAAPSEPPPDIIVSAGERVKVLQGGSKTLDVEIRNEGDGDADDVVVTFLGIDPDLRLTLPADCAGLSCEVGDVPAHDRRYMTVTVEVTGDKVRSSFEIRPNIGMGGHVSVERYRGGVDLAIAPIANPKVGRGGSAPLPIVVRNDGTEVVHKFGVAVGGWPGMKAITGSHSCVSFDDVSDRKTYGKVPRPGSITWGPAAFCTFEQDLAPGATFRLPATDPIKIGVSPDMGGPFAYDGWVMAVALGSAGRPLNPSEPDGRQYGHDDAIGDYNDADNHSGFSVPLGQSAADTAVVGGALSGVAGETKTLEVGVRNLGPTTVIDGIYYSYEQWYPSIRVRIPSGLRLVSVPEHCWPGTEASDEDPRKHGTVDGLDYFCATRGKLNATAVGETVTRAFTGTLTGEESAAGWVLADGGKQDGNAGNDKAAITIALTGGENGGGSGGVPGDGGGGGEGGGLPITGAPVGWVALGGAALLVAGAVAAFVFRRRRIVTTL